MALNCEWNRRQACLIGSIGLATNVQTGCQLVTTYTPVKLTSNTHRVLLMKT